MRRHYIKESDFDWLNSYYNIAISAGDPVKFSGAGEPKRGRVTGADGHHVLIKLNGEKESKRYHPTWKIEYL